MHLKLPACLAGKHRWLRILWSQETRSPIKQGNLHTRCITELQKPAMSTTGMGNTSQNHLSLFGRRTGYFSYLSSVWDEIKSSLPSSYSLLSAVELWCKEGNRSTQCTQKKKCHSVQAQYSLILPCVLMTYVQFTSKWQRQHQTQPIKPKQTEVQLSLSWNHRKGKDKYLPSVFQKEERAACCLTEHFLFWKCSTWRRDGNMNHRGWKSNRNTEGVKSVDKEATKNREQHLYIYGHACKPTLMAWHFRRSSVWKFPYLSPVVQWKKKLHHIP